jgi:L-ascorbate metabolism protein UlaG (beta-lactamase superfamily)
MLLTKYAHACVSVAGPAGTLLIDPGEWTGPSAFDDIAAILITHEHFDHIDVERLRAAVPADAGIPIFSTPAVVAALSAVGVVSTAIEAGDRVEAAGLAVRAVGGQHAEIWCGKPGCANLGFVIDESLYHPGDALFVPDADVQTLLLPISGPWLKTGEAIDFTRAVKAQRTIPIHDALLSATGLATVDRWVSTCSDSQYLRVDEGSTVEL